MKYRHHDHHGESGHPHGHHEQEQQESVLTEEEKTLRLAEHMLEHNRHHEEEVKALADRFFAAGKEAASEKTQLAASLLAEANLALMEAITLAAPKEA